MHMCRKIALKNMGFVIRSLIFFLRLSYCTALKISVYTDFFTLPEPSNNETIIFRIRLFYEIE